MIHFKAVHGVDRFVLGVGWKLSLDDEIRQQLSNKPNYGRAITIRHLLNHMRGLPDYLDLLDLAGVRPWPYAGAFSTVDLTTVSSATKTPTLADYH